MPVRRCTCGRVFATERGLKIHQTKSNCGCEASRQRTIAKLQIGKTPDDTGPESHHSSECVRVSRQGQDPPRARIGFPRGNDKRGWSGLDEELKQGLKKSLKDGSVKSFSDFIYNKCIERFGVVPVKRPQEKKDSRRQRELGRLKGEKKALRRRWKVAKEDEREGLSVLWEDVKRRVRDLRRAERGRQRKYERRRAMRSFFSDPYRYGRSLLDPPKSGELSVEQDKLEEHLLKTYSDALRHESLQERVDIPAVPLPTSPFCLASPSLEEVRGVVRKARNRSAPGPNGVPYLLYKRCPKTLYLLHSLIQRAWSSATVDDEWKKAEGVYIPKEKDSKGLNQFRPISLLNVEGKIFFSIMASRLTEFVMSNQYVDISVQKGGIPGVPGCIEHTSMIWEALQRAKRNRLSLYVVWLDLANAYGSVPHQLLWKTLEAHHVPQPVIHILQEYFSGFMMRFSTKTYTTRWVPLEVGIAMGCTISPSLFVLAMQILLKAAGSNIPEAHIGKGVYMPPIKAFMDDTTLIMNRKKVVQNTLDRLNNLLGWCRMAFKPAKSRSLALVRGKIRRDVFFDVAEQRIPTVSEEPVKSLGRVFDESLTDKSMRGAILQQTIEGLQAIEAAPLQGRFKVWMFQFVLLPRLLWPLTIYEIGLSVVEKLERKVNRYTRKWLGLPPALSSVALYSRSTSLRLPLRSIVEEYKLSKIRTQWMLNNSADSRIREVKPLLRSGRKFRAQNEIDESVAELTFEEVRGPTQTDRHAVGWNHLPKWSQASSSTKAAMINQERRRKVEQDRVTRAVQQSQQGKWTTWEDVMQRSLTWSDMWKMSPLRLAFAIRSVYDQLPSRDNLQKWGLVEDTKCGLCGGTETLHHVLSNCTYALANGRYTWRHNQVLREVCEAAKAAVSKANSRTIPNQRKIYFLREGFAHLCKKRCQTPRRDILAEANDWTVAADLEGMRHYPQVLIESGKRPDLVLVSSSTDAIILVELTVPWEDRLQYSNALEADKYADLSMDLEAKGYRTDLFPIEVGARGVVGRSTYAFLAKIGLSSRERKKAMTRMSEAAEAASFWIWHMRSQKKS